MVTPANNHSETSTAEAGVNPPERASRQRPFAFYKRIFRRDRYRLDERQRFYLLLGIFNVMLIFIMVLLSLRQRLTQEVRSLDIEITRVVGEHLACETENAALVATLSRAQTLPAPIVRGITPAQMVRSESGPPVAVIITGFNFFPGATASLDFVPVTIPGMVTDTTTIYGIVPASMAAGIYDLTVTNTDTQSSTLPRAFTVIEPVGANTVLESSLFAFPVSPPYDAVPFWATNQDGIALVGSMHPKIVSPP